VSYWAALLLAAFAFSVTASSIPKAQPKIDKSNLSDFAMREAGDAGRGKAVFADESRVACAKCHTTDGTGAKAGPDLGGISDKYPRRDLIRSILEPSATIAVGYGTTIIETKDDDMISGIIKQATDSWIELANSDGKPVRVPLTNVRAQRTSDLSLMPEGLEAGLTPQEFTDLVAYLESLHQPTTNLARVRGMRDEIPRATGCVELPRFFDENVHFNHPLWFGEVPGFTNRFVVLEHGGKSWIIERDESGDEQTTFVDLSKEVRVGGATGLLGMVFHPRFSENRLYYLKYQVLKEGRIVTLLVERQFSPDFKRDAGVAPRVLLEIGSVTQDHNGGALGFGADGYLYFGMGDTGPQRDPQGHGQNLNTLWGKILRLDVDRSEGELAYGIPKDNPFVGRADVKPEIWAYGFREPWRLSFDRPTGDLWVGDVGQDRVEEVGIVRAGENHGWNVFEGHTAFSDQYRRTNESYISPVFSYSHRQGVSVTGGYVYRGVRAPQMFGHYICGDYETRRIWALTQTNRILDSLVEIGRAPTRISSFGEDHAGELYVVGYDAGLIYRMNLGTVDPRPCEYRVIASTAEEGPILWRYTLEKPTSGWSESNFNDSDWRLSPAGFGTRGTPGAVVRTEWRTDDIWLRRSFTFSDSLTVREAGSLSLRLHHDEDSEVYLNGEQIAKEARWTAGYVEIPLNSRASRALKPGRNVIAIHCHQTSGGQYIDAGLAVYLDPIREAASSK
jgi:putative heme-binding domain-containing protein